MSNRNNDILFQLIQSLEKAEKRYFKLYIHRNSLSKDLKIVKLFDMLDKANEYDEKVLLRKMGGIPKTRLTNLKSHLYKQILASLRLLKSSNSIDLQLNEQFDYAHILYKKGLYLQSLRLLERAKEMANENHKYNFLPKLISLEKRIETLHITRSPLSRMDELSEQALQVSRHIDGVARLSNLSMKLLAWFLQYGHARNKEDEKGIRKFMNENLPVVSHELSFYERLHLYQSYLWYAYIRQDFLQYYRYARKFHALFQENELMRRVETGHYIKSFHYLLNAHFTLRNHREYDNVLPAFEVAAETERIRQHDNFRIQAFIYLNQARINRHLMRGSFEKGLELAASVEKQMDRYSLFVDHHRILEMNYKTALLYFGNGDHTTAIHYLQRIIQDKTDLRYDLQCYARLLHLIAHYETGNDMLLESLSKSVYRYMARMKNLTMVEELIFSFLKRTIPLPLSPRQLRPEFEKLLSEIKLLEKDMYQTRSFSYLDIISWLESKVQHKPMREIVHEKYLRDKRK
jgi:TPR repeat protein